MWSIFYSKAFVLLFDKAFLCADILFTLSIAAFVYLQIKLIRLVGMMLLVFSQEKHCNDITHVCAHQVGTGLLGKMVRL